MECDPDADPKAAAGGGAGRLRPGGAVRCRSDMTTPFATGPDHPACGICPAARLSREGFVAYDRPSRECPFNAADGHRYTADGNPACVHPDKVRLDPDRTAPPPEPVVVPAEPVGGGTVKETV